MTRKLYVSIPDWLHDKLGEREWAIVCNPTVRVLQVDQDGNRLPPHQQLLETEDGSSFWIDSNIKQIIG